MAQPRKTKDGKWTGGGGFRNAANADGPEADGSLPDDGVASSQTPDDDGKVYGNPYGDDT